MPASLPSDKLLDIQQLVYLFYWDSQLQSVRLCNVLARPPFVQMDMHNFASCFVFFRVTCWILPIHLLMYYFLFTFLCKNSFSFRGCLSCSRVWFCCGFLFLKWPSANAIPTHVAFYFQGSEIPVSCSGCWSGSMSKMHIAMQELQAVAPVFWCCTHCLSVVW